MTIGINSVAAFEKPRTGVEEYVYQFLKGLVTIKEAGDHRFILYVRSGQSLDFKLPDNFTIKELNWFLPMWTQVRLACEMAVKKPDILFVPVNVLPQIHPKNSVAAIHGLEYEHYPECYAFRSLQYLRWAAKYALKHARKIIAPSQSTKNDLIRLYGANPEKITVVHHGIQITDPKVRNLELKINLPYILYIGRIETKKNVEGLVEAFNLLKERYRISHKLVLVGARGFGYESLKLKIKNLKFARDIIETGYVSEKEKEQLLNNADLFAFVSFYEGFGIPILEAQNAGCPVITSDISSMPEVAGQGAVLVKPNDVENIAESIYKIINDIQFKKSLIKKGCQNVRRFSWGKCAKKTLEVLTN